MIDTDTMTQQERQRYYLTDTESYHLQPGDTVYVAHQDSNGTFLKLYIARLDHHGTPVIHNITWAAAHAMGIKPRDRRGEWVIHNPVVGMDRGFDLVYSLSHVLFKDRDNIRDQNRETGGHHDSNDPGYLLSHRWL